MSQNKPVSGLGLGGKIGIAAGPAGAAPRHGPSSLQALPPAWKLCVAYKVVRADKDPSLCHCFSPSVPSKTVLVLYIRTVPGQDLEGQFTWEAQGRQHQVAKPHGDVDRMFHPLLFRASRACRCWVEGLGFRAKGFGWGNAKARNLRPWHCRRPAHARRTTS